MKYFVCDQKKMISETAEDQDKLEKLRKQPEEAHRGSSSMDDMISQQTAEMEQAAARLRARERIFQDNEKAVADLAQQAVQIEIQIKDSQNCFEADH